MNDIKKHEHGYNQWLPELDAVAAAPGHHRVIFENEHVRVLDARIRPGETAPSHHHRWPSVVYTLETGDFVRVDEAAGETLDTRVTPIGVRIDASVSLPPLPLHSITNVGARELRAITIEVKSG